MRNDYLVHLCTVLTIIVFAFIVGHVSGKALGRIEGRGNTLLDAQKYGAGYYKETKEGIVFVWTPERQR